MAYLSSGPSYNWVPEEHRTARKEHFCEICRGPIRVGERYVHFVIPPWMGDIDVDSPADAYPDVIVSYYNTHKWTVRDTHCSCEAELENHYEEERLRLHVD